MAKQPNIILISVDDLRPDLISSYPDKTYLQDFLVNDYVPETPTLDAIAEESFCFQTCLAVAGYTTISFATTFTGKYPYQHGVIDFRYSKMRLGIKTIFEIYRDAGYKVVAMSRSPLLFTTVDNFRGVETVVTSEKELFRFITENRDKPLLVFVHFFECHFPFLWTDYDVPGANNEFLDTMKLVYGKDLSEFNDKQENARSVRELTHKPIPDKNPQMDYIIAVELYMKALAKLDAERLADLVNAFKSRGLWDNSYVLTFSDHGEIRDPVGPQRTLHEPYVYEAVCRTACMLKGPDITPGATTKLVGLVDLLPTLMELTEISPEKAGESKIDGRSLVPLINGIDSSSRSDWYLQEGWLYYVKDPLPPHIFERAVRTAEGKKYVVRGELTEDELQIPKDSQLAPWMERTFSRTQPILPDAGQISSDARPTPALENLSLLRQAPRFAIYDLNKDPFERFPISLGEDQNIRQDFLEKYRWLLARYSRPDPWSRDEASARAAASEIEHKRNAVEEAELAEKLKSLGYM